jgi:hypothetical protein
VLALGHGELVDREPVVVRRAVEVDHPRLCPADRALAIAVLHRDAVHQEPVQPAVTLDQVRALRPGEPAEGVLQRLGGQRRVEPGERVAQALRQHDLAVVAPLGRGHVGRDVRTVRDAPADALQPGEGGVLDYRFGERRHGPSHNARIGTAWNCSPNGIVASPS